jgi:hypothetical protein
MRRKRHHRKEVEAALRYAEEHGCELKLVEVMPGAKCTAHPTIKIADVE